MIVGSLALTVAALFTGAAVYVSLVEQPARLALDARPLLEEWRPSYKRGALLQAPLALIGCLLGLCAWWQTGDRQWLFGAIVLVANWPVTLLVILPTNRRLLAAEPPRDDVHGLVERWGRLHAIRTVLGAVATVLFLWASR